MGAYNATGYGYVNEDDDECSDCRGSGEIDGEECDNCGGTGVNHELEDN